MQREKWLFCLGVSACVLVLAAWPTALMDLRYDRTALESGQWWRVATGHMVHLNAAHLLLNLFALALICEVLWTDLSWVQGVALLFFSAIGISGLLWSFHPEVTWYAGLSGMLHGLWAGCAVAGWWSPPSGGENTSGRNGFARMRPPSFRYLYPGALILLALKLGWEAGYGPSQYVEQAIGAQVISLAHLYGALAGIVFIFLWRGIAGLRLRK